MENNELIDVVKKVDMNLFDQFMDANKSDLNIFEDLHSVEFDYSWLSKIEEIIPFLDTIVRHPRKFIMQEEEIVPIEKAKKISLESIRHLAQHTNLIQDVSDDGMITPIAVLNIHKEESFDIYENRFVYSLLINLRGFIKMRKQVIGDGSIFNLNRKVTYNGESKINQETIKINFNLETQENEALKSANPADLDVNKRIDRIELILNDFFNSGFIRDLANAALVKSPIRRTNVILKDQNFKKVLELWEFIERYDVNSKTEVQHKENIKDTFGIEEKLGMAAFLNYFIVSTMSDRKQQIDDKVNKYYIKRMINYFLTNNNAIDEKSFKKIIAEQFKLIKTNDSKNDKQIMKVLKTAIDRYKKNQKEALELLK